MSFSFHPSAVFSGLWSAAWGYRRRTLAALSLLLLAKAASVAVPLLLKAVVDRFGGAQGWAGTSAEPPKLLVLPVFLLLSYALLRFAGTLFTELRDLVFAPVTQRTVTAFAERAFTHLLSLSPRFHVQRNTGSLIRDVERGTSGVGFLLGAGLFTVVPTLVEFFAVLVVMAWGYSLWFTLVIVVTFVAYAGLTMGLTQKRDLRQRRVNQMDSRANGRMVDSLLNYETVKTYAREEFERERYAAICAQWVESSISNQQALFLLHIGQSAVIAAGVAAVMLLAGRQTMQGAMTVGDLVLVNAYVIQICLPLNALGFVFREARDALVNTENLFTLLAQKADILDKPGVPPLQVSGGAISFEHIDFSYEPGRQILRDVGLTIGPGQTVAVVGGSGSGKSTLARLLLRLYEVDGGRITVDGQDLREVRIDSLREAIGVVPQDTVLFNDTIAYNIGYGRMGAGMPEIVAAAQAAQLHEFILSLPQQYETMVGERGLKLSGGEKQRMAVARAFLKNPPIMIFDEATSALDTRAERAIQRELDRIAEGRTTLIIAHRLSTIVNADEIVVMDKGRIVERGRHGDLLERDGLYAQLWNLQRQQQEFERMERRLARQPLNLAMLMSSVVDGMRTSIEARQVRLYSDIDPGSGSVVADPSTLAQALRELCFCALQATPPGGRIELRLERHGAEVRASVADGRHGAEAEPPVPMPATLDMPAPHGIDAPLDPLQLRSTIERQGGEFTVEPATASSGMRYLMAFPLSAVAPESSAGIPPAMRPLPGAALSGLRVMTIDDDADAREALQALLELEGAAVLPFSSGAAALAWLQANPCSLWPQAVVCDLMLGDEDGHSVIRQLRQLEARRGASLDQRVPAIALSGLAQPDDRVRALMAGFQIHLAKPAEPTELVSALYALVGRVESSPREPRTSAHSGDVPS